MVCCTEEATQDSTRPCIRACLDCALRSYGGICLFRLADGTTWRCSKNRLCPVLGTTGIERSLVVCLFRVKVYRGRGDNYRYSVVSHPGHGCCLFQGFNPGRITSHSLPYLGHRCFVSEHRSVVVEQACQTAEGHLDISSIRSCGELNRIGDRNTMLRYKRDLLRYGHSLCLVEGCHEV